MLKDVAARHVRAADFTAVRGWGALHLAAFDGAEGPVSVRLHWADPPYRRHTNDGDEVFVAREGAEHLAVPRGAARVLVIERQGGA